MEKKRILIYAVTDECYYKNGKYCGCGVKMGVLEDSDCASCKDRHLVGIPYDTAIEKMARAMCSLTINCCQCRYQNTDNMCKEFLTIPAHCGYNYYELAEAALKALVGE